MITNKDSLGNTLTKEQIEYFKNTKVVDKKGNLLVCYHGSPNPGFKEFNPKGSKSQFGKYKFDTYNVNYFSTNKRNASSFTEFGYDDGTIYECYINIENPFIVDNKSEAEMKSSFNIKDDRIQKRREELFERIWNKWDGVIVDYSDYRFNQINNDLRKINLTLKPSQDYEEDADPEDIEYFDLVELGNNSTWGAEYPIVYSYSTDEIFGELKDEIKERIVGSDEDYAAFSTDEIVNYVISLNEDGETYDGIIIEDILDSKEMFSEYATDIITLKSSNQIKEITNKTPSSSNRIDEENIEDLDDVDFENDPLLYLDDDEEFDLDKEQRNQISRLRASNKGKVYYIPQDIKTLLNKEKQRYGWLNNYDIKEVDLEKVIKDNGLDNPEHGMFSRRVDRWGEDPSLYYYNKGKEDWLYSPIRLTSDGRIVDGNHRLWALYNNGYSKAEVLVPKQSRINEQLLLEVSRRDLINKSKNGRAYKDQSKGKNRWERKRLSQIAISVRDYNSIDMNAFFKKDILTIVVPVHGETDDYQVKIRFNGVVEELQNRVKSSNNKLDYRTISQALSLVFNSSDVYIHCSCP